METYEKVIAGDTHHHEPGTQAVGEYYYVVSENRLTRLPLPPHYDPTAPVPAQCKHACVRGAALPVVWGCAAASLLLFFPAGTALLTGAERREARVRLAVARAHSVLIHAIPLPTRTRRLVVLAPPALLMGAAEH